MKNSLSLLTLLCVLAGASLSARAQSDEYQPLSDVQLQQLLGPIALYPDPLIAEILPAATFPSQIVVADRYVNGGGDPSQIDAQPWDPSIQALAHYPSVLKWLDDNLNWTTELGQAFVNQQSDVMNAVQLLRTSASNLGNLQSTPQEQVDNDDGDIEILPADPDEMYVPVYQPDQVYYQSAGGSPFITFGVGFPLGIWLGHDFDWHNRHLVTWDRSHPRPANWYHEQPGQRATFIAHQGRVWQPSNRSSFAVNRGDRGYASAPQRSATVYTINSHGSAPAPMQHEMPAQHAAPEQHFSAPPQQHYEAPPQQHYEAPSSGAFVGIQSAHDTSAYSNRGRQSIQSSGGHVSGGHPSGGGGGGGNHGSGSQRH